jgi:prepilin-type N-terminal cleavage/methylation domain-containing protein
MKRGFTLIELVVYVAVLGMVLASVLAFLLWTVKSQAKTNAMRQVLAAGQRTLEIFSREVAAASSVYTPTSVFNSFPGQFSLQTGAYVPVGETSSYIDFYQCGDKFCMKRESQNPLAITSDKVSLTNLTFLHLVTGQGRSSVQITLTLAAKTSSLNPEYQASITLTDTVTLRSYVH